MKTYTLDIKTSVVTETPNSFSYGILHDAPVRKNNKEKLKKEFDDLHLLFLSRTIRLAQEATLTPHDQIKLTSLFQELIKIKLLLQEDDESL